MLKLLFGIFSLFTISSELFISVYIDWTIILTLFPIRNETNPIHPLKAFDTKQLQKDLKVASLMVNGKL